MFILFNNFTPPGLKSEKLRNVQNFWSHVTRVYQGSSSPVAILEEGPGYEVGLKAEEWENSDESSMSNHPYFARKISCEEFLRGGIGPIARPFFLGEMRKIPRETN